MTDKSDKYQVLDTHLELLAALYRVSSDADLERFLLTRALTDLRTAGVTPEDLKHARDQETDQANLRAYLLRLFWGAGYAEVEVPRPGELGGPGEPLPTPSQDEPETEWAPLETPRLPEAWRFSSDHRERDLFVEQEFFSQARRPRPLRAAEAALLEEQGQYHARAVAAVQLWENLRDRR